MIRRAPRVVLIGDLQVITSWRQRRLTVSCQHLLDTRSVSALISPDRSMPKRLLIYYVWKRR